MKRQPRPRYIVEFFLERLWGAHRVATLQRGRAYRARCPLHPRGHSLHICDNERGHIASFVADCGCSLRMIAAFIGETSIEESNARDEELRRSA